VLLIFLGILAACINGVSLPAMIIVFGDMIDSFVGSGQSQASMDSIPWENVSITMDEVNSDPKLIL
jgi:hypothetical protein